jgi:hypothetical protein
MDLNGTTSILTLGTHSVVARTVTNFGSVTWNAGDINLSLNATIMNESGATFDIQSTGTLQADPIIAGAELFTNDGLVVQDRLGGAVIACPFDNETIGVTHALVNFKSGTLTFTGGGDESSIVIVHPVQTGAAEPRWVC